jgi:DNA-binding beta-propeller fold protein YncE
MTRPIVAAAVCALAFLALAAPASADFGFVTQWGSSGTGAGQFQAPVDVAVDGSGNAYVVDAVLNNVQKFDPNGRLLATFGAPKHQDCSAAVEPPGDLCVPNGIAVQTRGGSTSVYVVDTYGGRIQQFTDAGRFVRTWGHLWCGSGPKPPAPHFCYPSRDTVDVKGNVYVDDASAAIQVFADHGSAIGSMDGPLCPLGCMNHGLAAGPAKQPLDLHVTDTFWGLSGTIETVDGDAPGALLTNSIFGGTGSSPAQFGDNATQPGPQGIATDPSGDNVYVADNVNDRVQIFQRLGQFVSAFGSSGTDPGQFDNPQGIAVDSSGNVYVADTNNDRIEKFGQLAPGSSPSALAPVRANRSSPRLASLTVTHHTFREGLERPGHKKGRRIPTGTTILFGLNEPASVTFTFTRVGGGSSAGRKVTKRGGTGLNRFRFDGHVGKSRLGTGRFRVSARATDVDGHRSQTKKADFKIVK